jgi:FixJ family two-component response regulator
VIRDATVFVVDDEEGIRNALRRVFRAAGLKVEDYGSARDFLEHYRTEQFGCLILDLRMPDMSGLELQEALRARGIRIPVIFLTGTSDVAMAVAAMRNGAVDFLEKPFDNADLVSRTRKVLDLGVKVRRDQLSRAEHAVRLARLTPRECQVMEQMLLGKLSKVIAGSLGVSPRTIDIHRARIMEKMQAQSLADLVRITLQAGPGIGQA